MIKTMRRFFTIIALVFAVCGSAFAQKNVDKEGINMFMFQATYAFQIPALDTRDLYGVNHTIGPSVIFKTSSNWLFTGNVNFIVGGRVKGERTDILGEGITTPAGEIIGGGGLFVELATYERGIHYQAEVGKIFPIWPNPNSGIFVQLGLGYLENRIRIDFQQEVYNTPYQVYKDYAYGYDRKRGGFAVHAEAGYIFFSNSNLLNFSLSLEATYARTRDQREYDFRVFYDENGVPQPVGYTNKQGHNDFYFGIRAGWMIPVYKRQPQSYYYN